MERLLLVVLLIAVIVVVDGSKRKGKSLETSKHGGHSPHRGRLSKNNLKDHKPVGDSPHSVYKDEWLKMTKYTKTKNSDCKKKCGKHQICLVDQTTGGTECFNRHNFREGRRLFRKFRNHDTKSLKKSIEDYSRNHQTLPDKHPKAAGHLKHKKHVEHRKDAAANQVTVVNPPTAEHKDNKHPLHKDHAQHKKHPQHQNHSNHKAQHKDKHAQHKNKHAQHKDKHAQHKPEITNNHSGPPKKEDKVTELHANLQPSVVHGHVIGINKTEAKKAIDTPVSHHKEHVQKAVIKKMLNEHHHQKRLGLSKPHHKHNHHQKGGKHHKKQPNSTKVSCKKSDLNVMSSRLTGWFALIHARNEEKLHHKIPIYKHVHKCDCQETSIWAFHQFDRDNNNHLNHTELGHLEANQNEPCLIPLMESCDHNLDSLLSRKEWCCCFAENKPPCLETKQSLQHHNLLGSYSPRCDENGYYQKEQCHHGTGYCWCVDLNGNEIPKTRALGKAHCEKLSVLGKKLEEVDGVPKI